MIFTFKTLNNEINIHFTITILPNFYHVASIFHINFRLRENCSDMFVYQRESHLLNEYINYYRNKLFWVILNINLICQILVLLSWGINLIC